MSLRMCQAGRQPRGRPLMIGRHAGFQPFQEGDRGRRDAFIKPRRHGFLLLQRRARSGGPGGVTQEFRHRDERFIRRDFKMLEHEIGERVFQNFVTRGAMREGVHVAAKPKKRLFQRGMLLIQRVQHLFQPGALGF